MKRIMLGIILLGALAMAATVTAQPAKHHATRRATTSTAVAAHAGCTDPASCPPGCGGHGSTTAAMSAAAARPAIQANPAICSGKDPAKCPASCRAAASGAGAGRIASR